MAARINKIRHDDNTRAKIKISQLVNRLTDHALGQVELEPTQVRAIEILLKKTLPDLSNIEHSGEQKHDVTIGWKSSTSKSTIPPASSLSPSTNDESDLPVL